MLRLRLLLEYAWLFFFSLLLCLVYLRGRFDSWSLPSYFVYCAPWSRVYSFLRSCPQSILVQCVAYITSIGIDISSSSPLFVDKVSILAGLAFIPVNDIRLVSKDHPFVHSRLQ